MSGRVNAGDLITIQVHLKLRNEAQADDELAAISDPDSPRFGQYLTDQQFENKYAPTAEDIDAVRAHLENHGLRVGHIPDNRAFVTAQGTTTQLEGAFGARLGLYSVTETLRRAPIDAPRVPHSLGTRVSSVLGLASSVDLRPPVHRDVVAKNGTAAVPGVTCSQWYGQAPDTSDPAYGAGYPSLTYAPCGYTPAQLRGAYGFRNAVHNGNDGSGVTIAVVDAFMSPTLLSDAQVYAQQHDPDYPLDSAQFTAVMAPGTPQTPDTGWYGEQSLDVEAVHAMAPAANIYYVGAQSTSDQDLIAAVNLIVSGRRASIISNSYGSPEGQFSDFVAWAAIVKQAGLKGIGVYFSTGDWGDNAAKFGFVSADFPASLPHVTAVGGTALALDANGDRMFEVGWENGGSILPPPGADAGPPGVWAPAPPGQFIRGAGGGTSQVYAQPKYQEDVVPPQLANIYGAPARVIPDVSMLGDPTTGFIMGQTDPATGTYGEYVTGGTSLACPLFAAVMALAEQRAGRQIGFANPQFYKRPHAFRDVAPGGPQAVALPPGGEVVTFDYPNLTIQTAVGYDNVTGLGTPDGNRFLQRIH